MPPDSLLSLPITPNQLKRKDLSSLPALPHSLFKPESQIGSIRLDFDMEWRLQCVCGSRSSTLGRTEIQHLAVSSRRPLGRSRLGQYNLIQTQFQLVILEQFPPQLLQFRAARAILTHMFFPPEHSQEPWARTLDEFFSIGATSGPPSLLRYVMTYLLTSSPKLQCSLNPCSSH